MQEFVIKSYGFTQLARLYRPDICPGNAIRTLKNWIEKNAELSKELTATGFDPSTVRTLTPRQVAIIVHHLGTP